MRTLGQHIASRLVEVGVRHFFGVPGDYNLVLLDQLISEPGLEMISCCNELNAGYAADGYARAKGVACCVVTFTVGGLSIINAIAGAYSERLPVICLVGGPNSNDYGTSRILHHTIGEPDFGQELRCFQEVTCDQMVISDLEHANEKVDRAVAQALLQCRPVYLSVSCNLAGSTHPSFAKSPVPYALVPRSSNPRSLEAALDAASKFLNAASKPTLVAGSQLRASNAGSAFVTLADASQYPVAVMPAAKGQVPETHPRFIGTYWGAVSTPFALEIIESSDAYLFAGPVFNDYSTVGYSLLIKKENMVLVEMDRVTIGGAETYGCVLMADFLEGLSKCVKANSTAYDNYKRMFIPPGQPPSSNALEPLRTNILFHHIQGMLSGDTTIVSETGDSWFNCQKLRLPEGCGYEFQMQYGSIGWSVGATLGYAQAKPEKRIIACIGDGSFQVTAQDVTTMIRNGQRSIIFLINNGGYSIEVEIHDGPYNVIHNWDYTGVIESFANGQGKCWTQKVKTEDDLVKAIAVAQGEKADHLCFIEAIVHKDDTSRELLEWGSRVSAANSRPSNPQ